MIISKVNSNFNITYVNDLCRHFKHVNIFFFQQGGGGQISDKINMVLEIYADCRIISPHALRQAISLHISITWVRVCIMPPRSGYNYVMLNGNLWMFKFYLVSITHDGTIVLN